LLAQDDLEPAKHKDPKLIPRKLGQILVDLLFITDDHLEMLVEEQAQNPGQMIGQVAQEMGLITDEQLIEALGEQFNLKTIDIEGFNPPADTRELVSDEMAQLYRVIPLQLQDGVLTVASCDPQNLLKPRVLSR